MSRPPSHSINSKRLVGYIAGQRGLSLVELMIAMIIALLIAAAVGSLFITSKDSFRLQTGASAGRESGAAVIEDVSQEIRRAGSYGCFVPRDTQSADGQLAAGFVTTAKLPTASASPGIPGGRFPIPTLGTAPNQVPRVGPAFGVFADAASSLSLPTNPSYTIVPGSDMIEFNFGEPVTFLKEDVTSGTSDLVLGQPVFAQQGMPMLIGTCTNLLLFRTDSGGLNGAMVSTLSHDPVLGDNVALANTMDYHPFSSGAVVMKLAATRLFVATTIADGTTNLYRQTTIAADGGTPQPFVSNVRDLRVLLALDAGGTLSWNTPAAITAGSNWGNVLGMQIHLVVSSSEATASSGPVQEMKWDTSQQRFVVDMATLAADKKPRRAYTVISSIRGRLELLGR